jgi:amino acid adenylation domain-containing protein
MAPAVRNLLHGFLRSSESFPDRPALQVEGRTWTFTELRDLAASFAATLQKNAPGGGPPLKAVFAYRTATAYAGVLGSLMHGHGYVPLNRTFPPDRTRVMLQRSGCREVIVDSESEKQLDQVIEGIDTKLLLVFPEREDVGELTRRFPQHQILGSRDLENSGAWEPAEASPDSIAYLLFTSGSTGIPKGVMVAQRNVLAFIDVMIERYRITEEDRFSQMFDMTFDLSAFDMFVAWERGACLCVPSQSNLFMPAKFINDSGLTLWFSVPSTAVIMKGLGMLKPGHYPRLRLSLFCGEALPMEAVKAWAEAAPNSILENLYGPTELTIACTLYQWDNERSPAECQNGLVPIGYPYPGMTAFVGDEKQNEVAPGEEGELLLTGPQLSLGYWQDEQKTKAAFIVPPGKKEVYYRTGDRVRRPVGDAPLVYLGRMDHQIKVHGHRVELGEVEAVLRDEAKVDVAIAIGWPVTPSGAEGLVAFIQLPRGGADGILGRVKERLPSYMVPSRIQTVSNFPLNANGKVDRKALTKILEEAR